MLSKKNQALRAALVAAGAFAVFAFVGVMLTGAQERDEGGAPLTSKPPAGTTATPGTTAAPSELPGGTAVTPDRPYGVSPDTGTRRPGTTGAVTGSTEEIVNGWPMETRDAARRLMGQYGEPDEATPSELMWHGRGQWKHIVLYRDAVSHEFPKPHMDYLQQTVNYRVPPSKFDDIANFNGSVLLDRTRGEISARCDREEMNVLALNLTVEMIKGKKSANSARRAYADAARALLEGGTVPLTEGFKFDVPAGATGDPDRAVIKETAPEREMREMDEDLRERTPGEVEPGDITPGGPGTEEREPRERQKK